MEQQKKSYSISEQKALHTQEQDDKIAKAMSRLNQRKQQAKEDEETLRILSKPRSKKYIELVQKSMRLTQRLGELETRRKELSREPEQEAGKGLRKAKEGAPVEPRPEQEAEKGWWEVKEGAPAEPNPEQEAEKGWWEVKEEASAEPNPEQEAEKGWWEAKEEAPAEPNPEQEAEKDQIEEINREMEQIRQELEELNRALDEEMPMYSRSLGFIYSSRKEETLINKGVIAGPGTPFFSLPDLLDKVQAQSEQEEKQWTTGNKAYRENSSETLLVVEIYMMAVCVVWDDGSVKCY